jgi:hypothetical protein
LNDERRATSRTIRAEDAKRAKVILLLADGTSYSTIEATLWCYRDYINRWRRRFGSHGLDGLRSRHQGQKPTVLTPTLEARILAKTQQRPPDGSTHWSTRSPGVPDVGLGSQMVRQLDDRASPELKDTGDPDVRLLQERCVAALELR